MGTVHLGIETFIVDLQCGIKKISQHDLGLVRRFERGSVSPASQSQCTVAIAANDV